MQHEQTRKRLVLFDVDGTVMRGHTQAIFLHLSSRQGILTWGVLLRVTIWFMGYKLYLVGDPTKIFGQAYAALAGRRVSEIERLIHENLSRFRRRLFPEAYTQTVFYADHISDLELLEFVDVPICVNPDARLRRIAKARDWKILRLGKGSTVRQQLATRNHSPAGLYAIQMCL